MSPHPLFSHPHPIGAAGHPYLGWMPQDGAAHAGQEWGHPVGPGSIFCLLAWSEQLGTGSLWEPCLSPARILPQPLGWAELRDVPNFVVGCQGKAVPSRLWSPGMPSRALTGSRATSWAQEITLPLSPWQQRLKEIIFPTLVVFKGANPRPATSLLPVWPCSSGRGMRHFTEEAREPAVHPAGSANLRSSRISSPCHGNPSRK